MKIQKIQLIGLLVLILALSIIISHFIAAVAIIGLPVIISLATGLIMFTDNGFSILTKAVIAYLFIGLNDIGIKLFAGGIHDYEGLGWIHMMLFIGLVPSIIMLLIGTFRDKNSNIWIKLGSILIFVILISVHFLLFKKLGVPVS
jgi:hypothetical protein